jgi:hypothetical protein
MAFEKIEWATSIKKRARSGELLLFDVHMGAFVCFEAVKP